MYDAGGVASGKVMYGMTMPALYIIRQHLFLRCDMKRITRPGGHRRKAWRLKKKYEKWFSCVIQSLMEDTLAMMPKNYFGNAWSGQSYDFCRIYK